MPSDILPLVTPGAVTKWYSADSLATLSAQVKTDTDTYAWGSAVVELQHTFVMGEDVEGNDLEDAQAFSPAVEFSTGTTYLRNIPIFACGQFRFRVKTPDSGADPRALIGWEVW